MGKLRPPLGTDQTRGEMKTCPYNYTGHEKNTEEDLICQINNASILAETNTEIMQ